MDEEESVPEHVSMAEISRIAGVGRAAVTNWRKRYADFPEPTGGPARTPSFSRQEVLDWLRKTGRLVREEGAEEEVRRHNIPTRFRPNELKTLQAAAELLGMDTSTLIRRACADYLRRLRESPEYPQLLDSYMKRAEATIAAVENIDLGDE